MYILKWFNLIKVKIYNILRYVIAHKLRHMCNLHIKAKETEISQKRVLSNKTNLILGYSSPLNNQYVNKLVNDNL